MLIPIRLGTLLVDPKGTKPLNSYTIIPKPNQLPSPFLQGALLGDQSYRSSQFHNAHRNYCTNHRFLALGDIQISTLHSGFPAPLFIYYGKMPDLPQDQKTCRHLIFTPNSEYYRQKWFLSKVFFKAIRCLSIFKVNTAVSEMNGKFSLLYIQKTHNAYNMVGAQIYLLKKEMDTANLLLTVQEEHTTHPPQEDMRV